jgi:GNAT superfamily N-acetyltransferase
MSESPSQIVIRTANGAADLQVVRLLLREYGDYLAANPTGAANICIPSYDRELAELPGPYAAPGAVLLLALVDGQPAGCVALRPIRPIVANPSTGLSKEDPNDAALELKRLWVRPACRRLSLGRKLVEAAIEHATSLGATALYLDTVPAAMPEANRLYTAMGFEPVARYNANSVPDVAFFRRPLASTR